MLSESTSISSSGPFLREIPVLKIFDVCACLIFFLTKECVGPTYQQRFSSASPVLPNGIMTYMLPAVFMSADGFLVKIIANSTQCFFKKYINLFILIGG